MGNVSWVKVHVGDNGNLDGMSAFVSSKVIMYVAWFPSGRMHVMFHSNPITYVYNDVPAEVWNELVNAESVGKKFNEIVKDKFTYTA